MSHLYPRPQVTNRAIYTQFPQLIFPFFPNSLAYINTTEQSSSLSFLITSIFLSPFSPSILPLLLISFLSSRITFYFSPYLLYLLSFSILFHSSFPVANFLLSPLSQYQEVNTSLETQIFMFPVRAPWSLFPGLVSPGLHVSLAALHHPLQVAHDL